MALQLFVGPWPLFSFLILNAVDRAPWTGISLTEVKHRVYPPQNKERNFTMLFQHEECARRFIQERRLSAV
jgi:hypothetical protein